MLAWLSGASTAVEMIRPTFYALQDTITPVRIGTCTSML
jgi:peptidoglycan biosynthesis protein MviN/MurJ (putative lipid II flippase)